MPRRRSRSSSKKGRRASQGSRSTSPSNTDVFPRPISPRDLNTTPEIARRQSSPALGVRNQYTFLNSPIKPVFTQKPLPNAQSSSDPPPGKHNTSQAARRQSSPVAGARNQYSFLTSPIKPLFTQAPPSNAPCSIECPEYSATPDTQNRRFFSQAEGRYAQNGTPSTSPYTPSPDPSGYLTIQPGIESLPPSVRASLPPPVRPWDKYYKDWPVKPDKDIEYFDKYILPTKPICTWPIPPEKKRGNSQRQTSVIRGLDLQPAFAPLPLIRDPDRAFFPDTPQSYYRNQPPPPYPECCNRPCKIETRIPCQQPQIQPDSVYNIPPCQRLYDGAVLNSSEAKNTGLRRQQPSLQLASLGSQGQGRGRSLSQMDQPMNLNRQDVDPSQKRAPNAPSPNDPFAKIWDKLYNSPYKYNFVPQNTAPQKQQAITRQSVPVLKVQATPQQTKERGSDSLTVKSKFSWSQNMTNLINRAANSLGAQFNRSLPPIADISAPSTSSATVLPTLPAVVQILRNRGVVGLNNAEKSRCFILSVVQCLAQSTFFLQCMKDVNLPSLRNAPTTKELLRLIVNMWGKNQRVINPLSFKGAVNAAFPELATGQHDVPEFILGLLNKMHEEISQVYQNEDDTSGPNRNVQAQQHWRSFRLSDGISVISNLFFGQLIRVRSCMSCALQVSTFEQFKTINLHIVNLNGSVCKSLVGCLKNSTAVEGPLDSYRCSECQVLNTTYMRMFFQRLPKIMIFQLSRFASHDKKLNHIVKYPEILDMAPYAPINYDGYSTRYRLFGVINHLGEGISAGHYTAFSRHAETAKWYCYNDSLVEEISFETVLNNNKAYVLFYEHFPQ